MKIMVSACLLGQKCKYNGGDNYITSAIILLKLHISETRAEIRGWPDPHMALYLVL